jgi:hypothetical protein
MTGKNKYANRSRISEAKFRELIRLFALNLDATQIAVLTGLNRNTVNRFRKGLRERIAQYCEEQSPLSGEIEVDESFFGPRRVKGKRGRGAFGKTIVFGLFKRNGKRSTPRSFLTAPRTPYKASSAERWLWRASSTPTAGAVIMALSTSDTANIFGWIMERTSLFQVPPTSTGSKDSGVSPNPG